ncbi:MAG: recombination protein RecR [Hyphomonadaceae bacterium]|nr:recombination protein RecR [Hyphomonadaceae bacterium]
MSAYNRPKRASASPEIERVVELLAKLPGLGPRSARRAALHLLKKRDQIMRPLGLALEDAAAKVKVCRVCGNLDTSDPCGVCQDPARDVTTICVVAEVGDLWALERSGAFVGHYHVLGGVLSALDGVRPEDLRVGQLLARIGEGGVTEVVLALAATVEGQTTSHYLASVLAETDVTITRLAHGVPIGGELDHLDDGTLLAALKARRGV